MMSRWIKLFLSFVILGVAMGQPLARGQFLFFEENPLIGKQAPDFKLRTLSGEPLSFTDYRGDGAAMIMFWATWCPSCRGDMRTLSGQKDNLEKTGIKVVLVNLEESQRLVKAYTEKLKVPFPVMLDEKSEVAEQYSIIGLPTVFFVDRRGVVVAMEHGLPKNFLEILNAKDSASPAGADQS